MTENKPTTPNEPGRAAESGEPRPSSARALAGLAPVVLFGLLGIGVLDLLTIPHRPTAIAHLVYFGTIGWAVSRLLKGAAVTLGALVAPLLVADELRSLDRELARWCMGMIQKRLRTGTMGVDVATLAARVAESLDATTEGASLRAALPTLRRSAGLCARCARPYNG